MTMTSLVIYHANCWDGFCAAWVAHAALGDIEAIPAQYGQMPPEVLGRHVFVLDFSYPRHLMLQLCQQAKSLVVLDHHKTAAAALDALVDEYMSSSEYLAAPRDPLPVIRFDMNKSGGRLAWEFFYPTALDAPELVTYTEDRDLWRHALPFSEEINAALRSYPLDFALWTEFHQRGLTSFIAEGQAIRRRERQIIVDHVQRASVMDLFGYRIKAVNATVLFSEIAGELAKGHAFGACYFDRQDGKRQWSLRSDESGIDVSEIAKEHGGGGHAHAAGFEEPLR